MAKVKSAQKEINDVLFHISNITNDKTSAVFHLEAFDKGKLDEKTVEVIRERVRIYLQNDRFKLMKAIDFLN